MLGLWLVVPPWLDPAFLCFCVPEVYAEIRDVLLSSLKFIELLMAVFAKFVALALHLPVPNIALTCPSAGFGISCCTNALLVKNFFGPFIWRFDFSNLMLIASLLDSKKLNLE